MFGNKKVLHQGRIKRVNYWPIIETRSGLLVVMTEDKHI